MSLLNALKAYWPFEEPVGPSVDVTGRGNDITWYPGDSSPIDGSVSGYTFSPQRATGYLDYGLDLNGSLAYRATSTDLQCVDTSFTFGGWVYCADFGVGYQAVLLTHSNSVHSYRLIWHGLGGSLGRFEWSVYSDDGDPTYGTAHSVNSPNVATNSWHYFLAGLDIETGEIWVQVDCGERQRASWSGTMKDASVLNFFIGRDGVSFPTSDQVVDEFALWHRVITEAEADRLCPGLGYPFDGCGVLFFGDYEFLPTFYLADDSSQWVVPMAKLPRAHGGRAQTAYLEPRHLIVRGGIVGEGPIGATGGLHTSLDAMRAALALQPQNFKSVPEKYWRNVRVQSLRNQYGPTAYCRFTDALEIDFVTDDPFQYSIFETTESFASFVTGATKVVTVGGNAYTHPRIEITVGGSGPETIAFTITNNTTGESFVLAGDVTAGDVIVVDCLDQSVEILGEDSIELFAGQWLWLEVGDNEIEWGVTSSAATAIDVSFRARWW